jgi:hypothetical protein
MKPERFWDLIGRVYDNVESALWALLIASVIFLLVFTLPRVPEIQAEMARIRAKDIAVENAYYCERLGLRAGTQTYSQCLLTLGDFRLKVEKRINEEREF